MPRPSNVNNTSITALLVARPDTQEEFLQTLQGLTGELEQGADCHLCVLAREVGGGPRFLLHIRWPSPQAMQEGMRSHPYRVLVGATSTLGSSDPALPVPS